VVQASRGIVIGPRTEDNYVILASETGEEAVYKKGDRLSDGSIVTMF